MSTYIDLDSVWRDRQIYTNPCSYELSPGQTDTWAKEPRVVSALPKNANERPLDFTNSINVVSVTLPYPRIELFASQFIVVVNIVAGVLDTVVDNGLVDGDIVITSSPGYGASSGIQRNVEYFVTTTTSSTFTLSLTSGGAALPLVNGSGIGLEMAVIPAASYDDIITQWYAALQLLDFPRIYLDFHSKRYADVRFLKTINGILADAKFVLFIDRVQFDDTLTPKWIHYKSSGEQVMRFKRDDPMIVKLMTRDGTTIPFFNESDLNVATNPNKQTMITVNVTPYLRDAIFANHMVEPIV